MPLGIDATTRFEFHNYTGDITESQLQSPSPYNTRINAGLTPTPIGNPGLAAIKAAARPAKVNYLYYVLNGDNSGHHCFTASGAEFNQLVAAYNSGPRDAELPELSPRVNRLAVLGHPVSHSRSPAMQTAALEALGPGRRVELRGDRRRARRVRRADAGAAGRGVRRGERDDPAQGGGARGRGRGLRGRAADRRRQHAELRRRADPRRRTPTPPGCSRRCRRPVEGKTALVLGAGGSARAAVWALAGAGAVGLGLEPHREPRGRARPGPRRRRQGHAAEGRLAPVSGEQARPAATS